MNPATPTPPLPLPHGLMHPPTPANILSPTTLSVLTGAAAAANGPPSVIPGASLGKDGDAITVRREVQRLVGEVERLEAELEAVFVEIDLAFSPAADPGATAARLAALMASLAVLYSTLRTTGLGALPLVPLLDAALGDGTAGAGAGAQSYEITGLLEAKHREVQELWRERQKRREGAAIAAANLVPPPPLVPQQR